MTWGEDVDRNPRWDWVEVIAYLAMLAILAYAILSDNRETPASEDTGASVATVTAVTSPTEDPSNYRGNDD